MVHRHIRVYHRQVTDCTFCVIYFILLFLWTNVFCNNERKEEKYLRCFYDKEREFTLLDLHTNIFKLFSVNDLTSR